jgi:hypothetical protein
MERYNTPYVNNIVNRELEQRGLGEMARQCDEWIDKYWFTFYDMERGSGRTGKDGSRHYHVTFSYRLT